MIVDLPMPMRDFDQIVRLDQIWYVSLLGVNVCLRRIVQSDYSAFGTFLTTFLVGHIVIVGID